MSITSNKPLTIIILSYNSAHIIEDSLVNLNFDKYDVVVVDNASADNTLEVVKKSFPKVKTVALKQNMGYGRGNNVVLRDVTTEFALILNPDAVILEEDIDLLLEEMRSNSKIATAGPVVMEEYPLRKSELDNELEKIQNDLNGIADLYYKKIGKNTLDTRFIPGAVLFLRVSIFKELGFYDENIFLFYEDDELCLRASNNGYYNATVLLAKAFHLGESSSKKSLRSCYVRGWHLDGWSKLYWKFVRKGCLKSKKSALRLCVKYLYLSAFFFLKGDMEKCYRKLGGFSGSFAFLIGLGAFKRNGIPRG